MITLLHVQVSFPFNVLIIALPYLSLPAQIKCLQLFELGKHNHIIISLIFTSSRIGTQSLPYQQTKTLSHKSGILAGTVARSMQPDKYPAVDHEFMMQPRLNRNTRCREWHNIVDII